jgi:hypothetical protein
MLGRIYITVFAGQVAGRQQMKKDIALTRFEINGTGYRFSGHDYSFKKRVMTRTAQ